MRAPTGESPSAVSARDRFAMDATYARNGFQPLWTRASAALLRAAHAGAYPIGVDIAEEQVAALDNLIETRFDSRSAADAANADRQISKAWLDLSRRVAGSSDSSTLSITDLSAGLSQAAQADVEGSLARFEPTHPQYRGLKSVLARYRALARDGGWYAIRSGELVRPGESDPRIPHLRRRLAAEGYGSGFGMNDPVETVDAMLVSDTSSGTGVAGAVGSTSETSSGLHGASATLDVALEKALRHFQQDHGLEIDGVLGPRTIDALNESPASKIRRIVDSMERWREFGPTRNRYIWVNVPSYTAEGWAGNSPQISMKAIVGRPDRPTPTFSDEIEYTVANPKWFVPVSIALRDKLPKLRRDPGYAARNNIRVYDRASGQEVVPAAVDWSDPASARLYRLVQSPGPQNALGQLKIIFPNRHSVYLHGTPAQQLFSHAGRAFSSGCIRLHDPAAMARWLAEGDKALSPDNIDRALQSGQRKYLHYARRTPVHLTYMTVTIGPDGDPAFWRDVYGRMGPTGQVAQYYQDEIESVRAEAAPAPRLVAASDPG